MVSNLIVAAKYFAIGAHGDQKRKYTGEPYWHHMQNICDTLLTYVNPLDVTEEMLAAAWLHDVVEDTNVSILTIQELFGKLVAQYVSALTEPDKSYGNREERKKFYTYQLSLAPYEVQTIKLADLLDNTKDIVEHDGDFARTYLREKRELLEIMTNGDIILYRMCLEQIGE